MNESIKVRDSFAEEDLRRIQEKALIFTEQFPQITEITLHKFIDHNADPFLPEPQRKEKHILVFRHDGIFDDAYQEGEFYEAAAAFLACEDLGTLKYMECAIDMIGLDDPLPKQASRMITPVSLYVRHDKEETTREKKKTDNFSNGGKGGVCIPRKFTGHEIVESFGLLDSGIFDLLKDGLQAYTSGTEKKVVNLDSLPKKRRYSLEEIVLRERLEEGKQATGIVMGSGYPSRQREARSEEEISRDARRKWSMQPENVLITPDGCYALSFTLPNDDLKRKNAIEEALSFIFKAKDVEEYGRVNGFISSGPSDTNIPKEQSEKSIATSTLTTDKEPPLDEPKTIYSKPTSAFPFIENAHIEITNYYTSEECVPKALSMVTDQPETTDPEPKEISSFPTEKHPEPEATQTVAPPPPALQPVNFFTRKKSGTWVIGFEGKKEEGFPHLAGYLYIAYLLERPGKDVSCIEIYQTDKTSNSMTSGQAAAEGYNVGSTSRMIVHGVDQEKPPTRESLKKHLDQLWADYYDAESDLERKEILAEITMVKQSLNTERTQHDLHSAKVQTYIKKGIDRAISALDKAGMNTLAEHLKLHINPNGKYGYIYTGTAWEITL